MRLTPVHDMVTKIPIELNVDKDIVVPPAGPQFQQELWTMLGRFRVVYDYMYYPESGKRTAVLRSVNRIIEEGE